MQKLSNDIKNLKTGVAIITGATAGIGLEIAYKLAQLGFDLHIPVRNMSKGEKVREAIVKKFPKSKVNLYNCDFSSLDQVKEFIEDFRRNADHVDLIISTLYSMHY